MSAFAAYACELHRRSAMRSVYGSTARGAGMLFVVEARPMATSLASAGRGRGGSREQDSDQRRRRRRKGPPLRGARHIALKGGGGGGGRRRRRRPRPRAPRAGDPAAARGGRRARNTCTRNAQCQCAAERRGREARAGGCELGGRASTTHRGCLRSWGCEEGWVGGQSRDRVNTGPGVYVVLCRVRYKACAVRWQKR